MFVMSFNTIIYPRKKYRCLSCSSNKICFFVDVLDFSSLVMINSGNAILLPISDPKRYLEFSLWQCKDCFDAGEFENTFEKTILSRSTLNPVHEKIQNVFSEFEKTFTSKSKPVILNDLGKRLTLKQIHKIESASDKPVSMIAVTRHQYDLNDFVRYENYVKNILKRNRMYYGLWPDDTNEKTEYDLLYVIPTDDIVQIQRHLNSHNNMNGGISQAMALVIFSNGRSKIIENST